MQILLFGKTGQVATELQRNAHLGIEIMALGRNEADLSKPDVCANIIKENSADVIINAAAYTLVDQAETEIALADESAMSEENSPYKTVKTLTDYIITLLEADSGD